MTPGTGEPATDAQGALPPRGAVAKRDRIAWALFAAGLLVQYVMFHGYVQRELAPAYPRMFDQAGYLYATYNLHELMREQGVVAGLRTAWHTRLPQTLLFPVEGALLMLFTGASRLGALSLGFLHFALFQCALVATLRRVSAGWAAPALALGLMLSAQSLFGWGGLGDFRTDFTAMCVQGLLLCAVLRTNTLADRRGWLWVGVAGIYLASFRYVATVYWLGTLLAFYVTSALVSARAAAAERPSWVARRRATGRVLLLLALAVGPLLWLNRAQLRAYYWRGQHEAADQVSDSAGRGSEAWLYYLRSLRDRHTGAAFLALAGAALLASAAARPWRRPAREAPEAMPFDLRPATLFLALAVAAPLAILTLNPAKSPVVANIMLPGLVLLVTLPAVAVARVQSGAVGRFLLAGTALASSVTGLAVLGSSYMRRLPAADVADAREATRLLESVAAVCRDQGWRRPVMLFDAANEFQMPWAAAALSYERFGWFFEPVVPVGAPLFVTARPADIQRALDQADVALLVRRVAPGFEPVFAFDRAVSDLRPMLLASAERELVLIGRRTVANWVVDAYARPRATIIDPAVPPDVGWAWVTDAGLTLTTSATILRARPWLSLAGHTRLDWLGGRLPAVRATVIPDGAPPFAVPVSASSQDMGYSMEMFCDPARLPDSGRVLIHLDFDGSFRPLDLGISADTRRLVIATPGVLRLEREASALLSAASDRAP